MAKGLSKFVDKYAPAPIGSGGLGYGNKIPSPSDKAQVTRGFAADDMATKAARDTDRAHNAGAVTIAATNKPDSDPKATSLAEHHEAAAKAYATAAKSSRAAADANKVVGTDRRNTMAKEHEASAKEHEASAKEHQGKADDIKRDDQGRFAGK